jgi:hypothetical protein
LGPAGRALQLGGHRLGWSVGRLGVMPGPPIGIDLGIGGLGQCTVRGSPVTRRRPPVDRGAGQGMGEPHGGAELDQSRSLGRRRRVGGYVL